MNEVNEIKICTDYSDIVINLNNVESREFIRNDDSFVINYLSGKSETFTFLRGNERDGSLYDSYENLLEKAEYKRVVAVLFDINLHL
jgi:hypothetical protein